MATPDMPSIIPASAADTVLGASCVFYIDQNMQIEYDPDKDEANRAKHGVSLAFGARVFEDEDVVIAPTLREGDEEDRFKAVGMVGGKLWTAIHVWRGDVVRFISVRRSNGGEQRDYHSDPGGPE